MKKNILGLAMVLVLLFIGTCDALLYDRGGYMIYDDDRNVTWYDYSYLAANWDAGQKWAADLSVVWNGITISDWRLPKTANRDGSGICTGYVCKKSDLGHLFYVELKNKGMYKVDQTTPNVTYGLINKAPFKRLKQNAYWSGPKDVAWYNIGGMWAFSTSTGYQGIAAKASQLYTMALRTGDVALLVGNTGDEPPPDDEPLLGDEDRDAGIWLLPNDFE